MYPRSPRLTFAVMLMGASALAGCMVGPNYKRPPVETPTQFKEVAGWQPAVPQDGVDRGDWWSIFNDQTLDGLEKKVAVSNQTVIGDLAAYNEARALVAQQRAALFPTVDLTANANEAAQHITTSVPTYTTTAPGGGTTTTGGTTTSVVSSTGQAVTHTYQVALGATWEPDLWGRVRREIENAKSSAQASAADLANAKLTLQSELAADYFQLRLDDAEIGLLEDTVTAYRKSLTISQNKYNSGVAARSDVLQAKSQLETAEANEVDLQSNRAQSEHAIAVLAGEAPSDLTIAPIKDWEPQVPTTPELIPSQLLQRRPDIAAAERNAKAENALIGVQVAGYFPDITLSGSFGFTSTALATLLRSSSAAWSYGASATQLVFDAGATSARVRQAKYAYLQSVAQYRQTVLTAFQQVEDELAAERVLQNEEPYKKAASEDSDQAVTILLNQYKAGTVDYTSVVTAQATALTARQTLLTLQVQRMSTQISLIEALGGGWTVQDLPKD
jgi:NodT family efflux transporter outer membrane factor (OMF) lipoprotein